MTDKQIMECKYKFQSIEKFAGKPYCTLHNETCEFINFVCDKNCQVYEDYKQLKRKEQECERLQNIIDEAKNSKLDLKSFLVGEAIQNEYEQQLDQLKAENKRLKKEIRLYDCINKWGTEQCRCACRCLGNEFCDAAAEKMKNIKQTLTEIKEIAENCSFTDNIQLLLNRFEQILQKISEVEPQTVDLGFWDKNGEYKEDIQTVDITKE